MKKRTALIVFRSIGILLLCSVVLCISTYFLFFHKSFGIHETTYLYIDTDDNNDSVRAKLETTAQLRHPCSFNILASLCGYTPKSGRYAISVDDNVVTVFKQLRQGNQAPVMIVIPSVRTMQRLSSVLAHQLMLDSVTLVHNLTDSAFCSNLGYDTATIACLFIPNTYEVYWNISLDKLMQRMQMEHDAFWTPERRSKAQDAGLTPNQVAILASIVDEETNDLDEKPTIAGLYLNRLRIGMPLQADPTIKFAMHDFTLRRILYKHLETESPYNTYLYPGLPPGPIRIASVAGIDAVLNHQHHNFLYMCAKEDFSGSHNFARTFREHQINARRYSRALNKRK